MTIFICFILLIFCEDYFKLLFLVRNFFRLVCKIDNLCVWFDMEESIYFIIALRRLSDCCMTVFILYYSFLFMGLLFSSFVLSNNVHDLGLFIKCNFCVMHIVTNMNLNVTSSVSRIFFKLFWKHHMLFFLEKENMVLKISP